MYKLKLIFDIKADAWNRRNACNKKASHGIQRQKQINILEERDGIVTDIVGQILDKTQDEANDFMIPYINKLYEKNKEKFDTILESGQNIIDENIDAACKKMEEVTKKPLYRNDFTGYLTTFGRMPYNYKEGKLWLTCRGSYKFFLGYFLHELLHFQFIHYYSEHEAIVILSKEQFEFLKEAMTNILNYSFKEFLGKEDRGYPKHQELRDTLGKHREKNQDFEAMIKLGAEKVQDYC